MLQLASNVLPHAHKSQTPPPWRGPPKAFSCPGAEEAQPVLTHHPPQSPNLLPTGPSPTDRTAEPKSGCSTPGTGRGTQPLKLLAVCSCSHHPVGAGPSPAPSWSASTHPSLLSCPGLLHPQPHPAHDSSPSSSQDSACAFIKLLEAAAALLLVTGSGQNQMNRTNAEH